MSVLLDQALLVAAVAALLAGGSRAGGALGAAGVPRLLVAATLAACAACLWALALGIFGLGSSPPLLTLAAFGTWLAARRAIPAPAPLDLARRWAALPAWLRATSGFGVGCLAALAIWALHAPGLVGDGLSYHVPIVTAWVDGGDAPALHAVTTDAPLEAYPLTSELLVSWATGISRSFVPVSLSNPVMLLLLALAGWSLLRSLGAERRAAALALVALGTSPLLITQLNTFTTDLPALAWLVCTAALCAAALQNPRLLAVALLAGALAIGTKTTPAPLVVLCLLGTGYALRRSLRPYATELAVAGAVAVLVGGYWYIRNTVLHASPLWPFAPGPWGDPVPHALAPGDGALLRDPGSASGRFDDYGRALWGDVVLLVGALAVPLLTRSRRALIASLVAIGAFLIWTNAPFTAFPADAIYDGLQGGSTRYLLPGIAVATLAIALAASGPGRARHVFTGLLGLAAVVNLVGLARLGLLEDFVPAVAFEVDPMLPSAWVPLLGGVAGGALALAAARLPGSRAVVAAVGAAAVAGLLAIAATGYTERSSALDSTPAAAAWLLRAPGFADGDQPVAFEDHEFGTLAGDRIRHPLELLQPADDCATVDAALARGWVLLDASNRCSEGLQPAYEAGGLRVYAPGG